MARYKPQDHNKLLLPVVLSEQIIPGSFAFALNYLIDNELDLTPLDAQFRNDEVGASAYNPRVMLKRLTRLNYRGREKVNTQWNLYCMVHNIEKLAKTPLGQKPNR